MNRRCRYKTSGAYSLLQSKSMITQFKELLNQNGFDIDDFSFSGYDDEKICLEKKGELWWVYIAERGQREDKFSSTKLKDALIRIIQLATDSENEEKKLLKELERIKQPVTRYMVAVQSINTSPSNEILTVARARVVARAKRDHTQSRDTKAFLDKTKSKKKT